LLDLIYRRFIPGIFTPIAISSGKGKRKPLLLDSIQIAGWRIFAKVIHFGSATENATLISSDLIPASFIPARVFR
jgi:hypothetical protein